MKSQRAFTINELVITSAVILILSTLAFRSMLEFNEQRKLRTAAVELSGYLQIARAVANAENQPCRIKLASEEGGVFTPDSTLNPNACRDGTIAPKVQLGGFSGSRDLKATPLTLPGRGNYPITFTPGGTVQEGATLILSSANVPKGEWCVDVEAPLGMVRLGWRGKEGEGQGECNYSMDQEP